MAVSLTNISEAGVAVASMCAGYLKTIAPPDRGLIKWTGLASVLGALAFLAVKLLVHLSKDQAAIEFWGLLAFASLVLSVVLCFIYFSALQSRTVEYGVESRIAGTDYTEAAQAYSEANPTLTREQILFDYIGNVGAVWTPDSLEKSTLVLGVEYSLFIVCLAFTMYLGLEVVNNTWTHPPAPPKPTLQQRAAALKDVHFELDKSELQEDATEKLADDAAVLVSMVQQFPGMRVIVEGYCDDRGSLTRNLALGYERAHTVGDSLVHAGISPDKLQLASYGKGSPVCSEAGEPCMRRNRRVHLIVVE